MTEQAPRRTPPTVVFSHFERPRVLWYHFARWIAEMMPKGLYARSLLIVILPMVILQSVIAYFFMERHWQTVTQRLSGAVVQDIAAVIDLYRADPRPENRARLRATTPQGFSRATFAANAPLSAQRIAA